MRDSGQDGHVDAGQKPKVNRATRGREATRNKLIAAAARVMSETGVEGATIAAIASEADVGFGSFYNHFKTKEEIAQAVFARRISHLDEIISKVVQEVYDPAIRVGMLARIIILQASHDPIWGWFLIRSGESVNEYQKTMRARALVTIQEGLATARFSIPSAETAVMMSNAAIFGVIRGILDGELPDEAATVAAELILRSLGVPGEQAAIIASMRIPEHLLGEALTVS